MLDLDTDVEKASPTQEPAPAVKRKNGLGWRYSVVQIDRDLRKQGLYNPSPRDCASFERNIAGRMYASRFHFRFPTTTSLVKTPEDQAGFYFRMATDPWIAKRAARDRLTDLSASKISDIFGVSPHDLKDSHLQALLEKGHFGTWQDEPLPNYDTKPVPEHFEFKPLPKKLRKVHPPYDARLAVVAYLSVRDLATEDQVETYLPELRYEEFHRLRAKIHREVEKTLPERFKRFQAYWMALTIPQKQALRLVHMSPERGGQTYPEAARLLGITHDALKERLKSAVRTLKEYYPDLKAVRGQSGNRSVWKQGDYDRMRMFNSARARTPAVVTRLHPQTRKPLEVFTRPKVKTRTPVPNLAEMIANWDRTTYEPLHNGVASPRFAHMTGPPPAPTLTILSPQNEAKARARIQQWEETGVALQASQVAKAFTASLMMGRVLESVQ